MSYADVFKPGGNPYDCVDRLIDRLERGLQWVAEKVLRFIVRHALDGTLATLKPTDAEIAEEMGISPRAVQKGLNALDVKAAEQLGQPLIDRESGLGCHGRRTITLAVGLAPSGSRRPAEASPPVPPQSPPEREDNTTTEGTGGRSSSSPETAPEKPLEPPPEPPPELVQRAQELIPGTTAGQVAEALADGYTAAEVDRALDEVPEHNRKPGNLRVKGWGWIRRTLANFRKQGGAPPKRELKEPPPARPKPPPEPSAPPKLLSAEQVAELVAACCRLGPEGRFNRIGLGMAIRGGEIPAELMATIPAELLAAPEVTAPRSS
jgi:hypothetical protein